MKATAEERELYEKISSKNAYLNQVVFIIKRLRETAAIPAEIPAEEIKAGEVKISRISHEKILGGKAASKGGFTLNRFGIRPEKELNEFEFYEALKVFVLTSDQLDANGFPRPDPEHPGMTIFRNEEVLKKFSKDETNLKRICCRCGKEFRVTPSGQYLQKEDCSHHFGRAFKRRSAKIKYF